MSDDSRLVASSAKNRKVKYKTVYKNISYSRCVMVRNKKERFGNLMQKATHLEKSSYFI